ncbi:Butyryl-CoA dehydrogenase [Euzebya pacifica]|uniref:Butyryl-CoA dehydrogenase n=1 Tax=Euzebya pacifica TaxID=1608957 RepID=A0A346XWS1_9ACTN|nr:acyl-CoA dehydrogenase family protein [Euzebya pacifica]AXV06668.1 Butyryl-CoA dehydrogenase [Euzebya pacifica]
MDFALTDEQRMMQESVRALMAREAPPEKIREWDQAHEFPDEVWRKLGAQGWLGLTIPEEFGGTGASVLDTVLFSEQLSYCATGLSAAFQRSACYGGTVISRVGTQEQKETYLPPIASGESMVAVALTEPGAGSDAAALQTRATRDGDHYLINGQKVYTSGADQADWLIVAVRTDPSAPAREGISTFIVPTDLDGLEIRRMDKLGNWMVSTCEVYFDDVAVPAENLLGDLNGAWQSTLSSGLDAERLIIGSHCTGSAQRAFDVARDYAVSREQFGRPITSFQMIKQKFADMAASIQGARLMTQHAAWLVDQGLPARKESSMVKMVASEMWNDVVYEAMQACGGWSYMMESELQRQYRDARLYTIGGGTSEIQRLIIAKELGL